MKYSLVTISLYISLLSSIRNNTLNKHTTIVHNYGVRLKILQPSNVYRQGIYELLLTFSLIVS